MFYLTEEHTKERKVFNRLPEELKPLALEIARHPWHLIARDKQLDIRDGGTTLITAGRGWGKSVSILNYIAYHIKHKGVKEVVLIGETFPKVNTMLIDGDNGILKILEREGLEYTRNHATIKIPKLGARIVGLTGEDPDRFRGFNAEITVLDELAAFAYGEAALQQARLITRKGVAKLLISTTPKPYSWFKDLARSPHTQLITGSTKENKALSAEYVDGLKANFRNANMLLQELDGMIIDYVKGALWQPIDIVNMTRPLPDYSPEKIVVSLDPSLGGGDEFGIVQIAKYSDCSFVLKDYSGLYSPDEAADLIVNIDADEVLLEGSGQQLFFKAILAAKDPQMKIQVISPRISKMARAELAKMKPVYIDEKAELENLKSEMCSYDGTGISPNRLDAYSQAINYLYVSRPTPGGFGSKVTRGERRALLW